MYPKTELSQFFSFLLNVLGMFVGVIISKYYQGESIFPIRKTLALSFGTTILYFLVKFIYRLNIEPYGDIVICASVGLIAETIFTIIYANKVKIAELMIKIATKQKFDMDEYTKGTTNTDTTKDDDVKTDSKKEDNNRDDFLSKL